MNLSSLITGAGEVVFAFCGFDGFECIAMAFETASLVLAWASRR